MHIIEKIAEFIDWLPTLLNIICELLSNLGTL